MVSSHCATTATTPWSEQTALAALGDRCVPAVLDTAGPPAGPACGELGMGALLHFRSLMALEGQSVQLARMAYDRLYAYERIAAAHASAHDPLRRVALELFQAYHWREQNRTFVPAS